MGRLNVDQELLPLRRIRPVLWRPLLPLMNAVLMLLPRPFRGEVKAGKRLIASGQGDEVSLTVIKPPGLRAPAPCLVFYHGGAFVLEAAPHHYSLAARLAQEASCIVILPRYRLAPRHPYPVPLEDCFTAYEWVRAHAAVLGIDPCRIAVGGDSAGGNLAAAACLLARDRKTPPPCFQLLLYPVTDRRMESASMRAFRDTAMWNAGLNREMWKRYLPGCASWPIYYASPMEARSLADLPDAYLETAELDPLWDEGVAYAEALRNAGAEVQLVRVRRAFHGFDLMKNSGLVAQRVIDRARALKQAFLAEGS